MNELGNILNDRLEHKGLGRSMIPAFMRSLANSIHGDPHPDLGRMKRRLRYLGWDEFDLDYHTMQMAVACIEDEGFGGANELRPAPA
ncbi:MAG: hypothetical protein GY859_18420 [Desulfobacterales bacterium]|nr:hypothetical protein [Desulfobacterales bacterium]